MWRRNRDCARRFLIDPVKEMVNKGIETATTGAGWLKGGPQMVSDVVCGIVDTWVSVIDPNEGTIRKAMSGDAATLDELASLASTIGSIVFVVYVCMTAVNLFLATAESEPAWESNCRGAAPPLLNLDATHWLISAQVGPRLLQELPHDSQALESHSGPALCINQPISRVRVSRRWRGGHDTAVAERAVRIRFPHRSSASTSRPPTPRSPRSRARSRSTSWTP